MKVLQGSLRCARLPKTVGVASCKGMRVGPPLTHSARRPPAASTTDAPTQSQELTFEPFQEVRQTIWSVTCRTPDPPPDSPACRMSVRVFPVPMKIALWAVPVTCNTPYTLTRVRPDPIAAAGPR